MGLMGVDDSNSIPLYLHVVQRILRDLRLDQQALASADGRSSQPFQYRKFKAMMEREQLTPAQAAPLKQRLDTLESFMVSKQAYSHSFFTSKAKGNIRKVTQDDLGTDWTPKVRGNPLHSFHSFRLGHPPGQSLPPMNPN